MVRSRTLTVAQEMRLLAGFAERILWGGVVLGNLPLVVIMSLAAITNNVSAGASWLGLLRSLGFGALFGVAGAALFWAISIRGTAMAGLQRH